MAPPSNSFKFLHVSFFPWISTHLSHRSVEFQGTSPTQCTMPPGLLEIPGEMNRNLIPCCKARGNPHTKLRLVGNVSAHLSSTWRINPSPLMVLGFLLHKKGVSCRYLLPVAFGPFSPSPWTFPPFPSTYAQLEYSLVSMGSTVSLSSRHWWWFWLLRLFSPTVCTYWNCSRPGCVTTPSISSPRCSPKGCDLSFLRIP